MDMNINGKEYEFWVITWVPPDNNGNSIGDWQEIEGKFHFIEHPVFHLGEIIITSQETLCEIGGMKRDPQKWNVKAQMFPNLEDAVKCAENLMRTGISK